jgi:pseudouridine-5'-monophosphatase
MFKQITHIIYDVDGLLLDTESIHERVNSEIARRYDRIFDKFLKIKIAGRTALESAQIIVDYLQLPLTPKAYIKEKSEIIYQLYPDANPLPGAILLTQHFSRHRIPQAIATSSSRRHFELKMTYRQQWLNLFTCIVVGDDPELVRGKPAPDIFLLTAKRLGANPEQCLVFEDSIAGMEAALAAGMSVVVVPDRLFDRLLFENAHQILDSLTEFEPKLWNLPQLNNFKL